MTVEAELLRYFQGRRATSRSSMMIAERFLSRRRTPPESPYEDMLFDLVRREFMHLMERARPEASDEE